ncbi:MAG: IMP cyclohydrolase [Clostridia bacterium]|nr:IMP cyclohydrolase [Clostridia bacterium]
MLSMSSAAGSTTYPGRGIIVGKSSDGQRAVLAYFIMGRSVNSRNRVFVEDGGGIRTEAFDPSQMVDPSLIIYWPVRQSGDRVIVTNGDQTDTIYDYIRNGASFIKALRTREFEPDAPNYTPRVSAMVTFGDGDFALDMGILRAGDDQGSCCHRVFWEYEKVAPGTGYFLHTYLRDGDPIPSFTGDPEQVSVGDGSAKEIADALWQGLDENNKVSLWVMTRDLATGEADSVIINRNVKEEG